MTKKKKKALTKIHKLLIHKIYILVFYINKIHSIFHFYLILKHNLKSYILGRNSCFKNLKTSIMQTGDFRVRTLIINEVVVFKSLHP
jgi:hypothetical protein